MNKHLFLWLGIKEKQNEPGIKIIGMDTDKPYEKFDIHKKKYPPGQLKEKKKTKRWLSTMMLPGEFIPPLLYRRDYGGSERILTKGRRKEPCDSGRRF